VAPRLGHGKEHLVDVEALDKARQALRRVHPEPTDILPAQSRIGVDERHCFTVARALQGFEQLHAGRLGAVDQHLPRPFLRLRGQCNPGAPEEGRGKLPAAPDEGGGQHRIEQHHRARHAVDAREVHQQPPVEPRQADGGRRKRHPAPADEAGDQTVDVHLEERGDADAGCGAQHDEQVPARWKEQLAHPHRHGEPQRQVEQEEVVDGQDDSLLVPAEIHQPQGEAPGVRIEDRHAVKVHQHPKFPGCRLSEPARAIGLSAPDRINRSEWPVNGTIPGINRPVSEKVVRSAGGVRLQPTRRR
jgi:hypothetical protein